MRLQDLLLLMMRQLGEMVVEEPVSGSFSHFAYKYWDLLQASCQDGITGYSMYLCVWRS